MAGKDAILIESNKAQIEQEIRKFHSGKVANFLREAVKDFPEYFWTAPASLEKYHYPDERTRGGLVLHVRRVCRLSESMAELQELNAWEQDVLRAASLLHDSFARGIPPTTKGYSDPFHAIYPAERFPYNGYADRFIDKNIYDEIMDCVVSHLGRYSVHPIMHSRKKLATLFQIIDHMASRDYIKVEI